MKRTLLIATVVIFAVVAALWGYRTLASRPTETAATPEPEAQADLANVIWASGKLAPSQWTALSPDAGGAVQTIDVRAGDQVEAGQVLLRLDAVHQKAALAQAQAQLQRAEAQLAEAMSGARDQEIAAARAAVDAAQARLDRLQQGKPLAEAEAGLAEAQAALRKVREGASADQLIAAQTDLANAAAQLRQAQAAYDQVSGMANVGARPESALLEQATNAHNAAKARFDDLKRGASAADVAGAEARVRRAQAQLQALQSTQPADIAAAQADVRQLKAQLDLVAAGARPEQVQALAADVAAATAAVEQAQAALADTELRAPIAGAIAWLDARVGEQAVAGKPVVILGDTSHLQVETTDLRETDVTRIHEGMPVEVTFDALPGRRFEGVITRIAPMSNVDKGSTNYTVTVEVKDLDPALRWGMTAFVNINVGS